MTRLYWVEPEGCQSDRGWLLALCGPYERSERYGYTYETMPYRDTDVPGGWREQESAGFYLDYGPLRPGGQLPISTIGHVFAVSCWSGRSQYFATVEQARTWLLEQAAAIRPGAALYEVAA